MNKDPLSPDFDAHLRAKAGELRQQRGPCPNALTLLEFRSGALPQQESARVREHISACGLCDTALSRLDGSLQPRWNRTVAVSSVMAVVAATALFFALGTPRGSTEVSSLQNALLLDLNASRSMRSPGENVPSGATLALSFFIPMDSSRRYSATLRDPNQVVVLRQESVSSFDGTGNCILVWTNPKASSGEYVLTVEDDRGTSFPFRFRIE